MAIPARTYRVKSPNGEVHSMGWHNARDLVANAGFTWSKDEKEVLKEAQAEAAQASFVEGNDPTTVDVEALQKKYAVESAPKTVDEMTRDELVAHAEANDVEIDKRWGNEKLKEAIKAAQQIEAGNEAEAA